MEREKQFQSVEGLITWYDEIMNHYEAAFWVHYRMLNEAIETWVKDVDDNSDLPRVTYFVHTEYMSMVFSEMLLTIEVLLKAELTRCKANTQYNHNIIPRLDEMMTINDSRCNLIAKELDKFRDVFEKTDINKSFIHVRYIDYDNVMLDTDTASIIKEIIIVLDNVYEKYYSDFDIGRLLYLSLDVSLGEDNLSEDEIRRLKEAGCQLWEK